MVLTFRPATPADTEDAIALLYSSGPATFDYVFQHPARGTAMDFLRYAFSDGAGEFGCRNHTLVIADGEIVGIGTGFGRPEALRFIPAIVRQAVAFYGTRRAIDISRRGRRLERVLEPPRGSSYYIGHLGVAPHLRSMGIGKSLVEHLLAQGRAQGRTTAVLDVAIDNPRAQSLYERLGFTVTHETTSDLRNAFGAVPDHHRMERPIFPST